MAQLLVSSNNAAGLKLQSEDDGMPSPFSGGLCSEYSRLNVISLFSVEHQHSRSLKKKREKSPTV